jgi:hypothetical protein
MNGREDTGCVYLGYESEKAENTKEVIRKFGGLVPHHISYHQQNTTRDHMEELYMDRRTQLNWILLN